VNRAILERVKVPSGYASNLWRGKISRLRGKAASLMGKKPIGGYQSFVKELHPFLEFSNDRVDGMINIQYLKSIS